MALLFLNLVRDLHHHVLSFKLPKQVVELDEALSESKLVLFAAVGLEALKNADDLTRAKLCHFLATVAVEDAEKAFALWQLDLHGEGVLHGAAPPLHARCRVAQVQITFRRGRA